MGICDHCSRAGEPYEYRGRRFDGLVSNRGERLCPTCADRVLATEGVDVQVTTRSGASYVYNTVRDADLVQPSNPEGIDGRDLAKYVRRRSR